MTLDAHRARVFYVGRRVLLRALTHADIRALYPRAEVAQALSTYKPGIRTDAAGICDTERRLEWLGRLDPAPEVEALLVHKESDTPFGFICLSCIDPRNAKAEMALALFRGRGSRPAGEALLWTLEHAFRNMGLHKLIFHVLAGNELALRAAQASSLTHEAVLQKEVVGSDARRADLHRFCLFAQQWPASRLRARLLRMAPLADPGAA